MTKASRFRLFARFAVTALLLFMETGRLGAEGTAVYVIPIHGDIEPSTAVFVRKNSESALHDEAGILIYDIDTFGGRVDSALRISSYIGSIRKARTVAFVRAGSESLGVSWSAGALIIAGILLSFFGYRNY